MAKKDQCKATVNTVINSNQPIYISGEKCAIHIYNNNLKGK